MKKTLFSLLFLCASACGLYAGNGDARIIVENSDGTYSEYRTTFSANAILTFGNTAGSISTLSPSSFASASSVPITKSGTQSFTLAGGVTKTITFTTPLPAGSTYTVHVQGNGLVTSGWATNQTLTGFTLNIPVAVLGTIGWDLVTITTN